MATTYSQPQKENREENDFHLFTGSIMDPFKTGPTGLFATALVSLGKSGRFHLVWHQNRPQLQTGQFPLTQIVSSQWPHIDQLLDGQKLPKNRLWRICINTNCENQNDWLAYWSGRKKYIIKKNIYIYILNYRLDYWSGHGRTNRTVCYGPEGTRRITI